MQQEHLHQDYATRTPKISASFKLAASPPNPLFDAEMGNPFVAEDAPHLAMVATRPTIGSSTPSGKISFPFKLHAMLAELESTGQSHIASFQPHGRSFTIYKQDEFVSDVLPRFVYSNVVFRAANDVCLTGPSFPDGFINARIFHSKQS
jgi:HSF-type DNA-binding